MAADRSIENFQGLASFFVLGDFWKIFFSKCSGEIELSEYPNGFLFEEGRGSQKQAQSQKSVSEHDKNDNKAGITRERNQLRTRFLHQKLDLIQGLLEKWC